MAALANAAVSQQLYNYFTLSCAFGYSPVTFPVPSSSGASAGSRGCACILPVWAARASAAEDLQVCEPAGTKSATCVYTGPIRTSTAGNHYPVPLDGTTSPQLTTGRRKLVETIVNQVVRPQQLTTIPVTSPFSSAAVCGTSASHKTPCPVGQVRVTDSASFHANQASRKPKDSHVFYACAPPLGPRCSGSMEPLAKGAREAQCKSTLLHTATCGPKAVIPNSIGLYPYECSAAPPKKSDGTGQTEYCPSTETACPSSSSPSNPSSAGYECLDPRTELQSCGGCATLGEGMDCTAIPGAMGVGCQDGQCVVFSCKSGFRLRGGACRRTNRDGRARMQP